MKTYELTNKAGYTTRIEVIEITAKSVYYRWAGKGFESMRSRMSLTSFSKFKEVKA